MKVVFCRRLNTSVINQKQLHMAGSLGHKPEGCGFDSRWCHWNFSLTSFRPHCGLGVDSASNRNEYQEYFLGGKGGWCVGLTIVPSSCADCLEIWDPHPPGILRPVQACNGIDLPFNCTWQAVFCWLYHHDITNLFR